MSTPATSMPSVPMPSARDAAITHLEFVRSMSVAVLNGFPAEKMTFQRTVSDNHPVWVMGHIASTDAWMGSQVDAPGTGVPAGYDKLFGMGSVPSPNPKDYPDAAEVRAVFDATRAALLKCLRAAPDEMLLRSLKEKTGGFLEHLLAGALLSAWHEGWHMGQVATLRKELKLPSAF